MSVDSKENEMGPTGTPDIISGLLDSTDSTERAKHSQNSTSESGSTPLILAKPPPKRNFKLWCLRTGRFKRERTAAAAQAPRYANYLVPSLIPDSTSLTTPDCVTLVTLPGRPENVFLKRSRLPDHHETQDSVSAPAAHECCFDHALTPQAQAQSESRVMGLSKTQRISILLGIDGAFFFLELGVGYYVHSLALVADAFHMLNDVISLCVGLWAVSVAKRASNEKFTYGWQRAETLGALVNGVFLVALCLSIFLEAIQRFVEPQVVSNPMLVLIVGCFGLASNLGGLFLFHDHGHSHGDGDDDHSHSHDPVKNAEEGHSHAAGHTQKPDERTRLLNDQDGSIEDVLPQVGVAGFKGSVDTRGDSTTTQTNASLTQKRRSIPGADQPTKQRRRASIYGGSIDDMPDHPFYKRSKFIGGASHRDDDQSDLSTDDALEVEPQEPERPAANRKSSSRGGANHYQSPRYSHVDHIHQKPKEQRAGGGGGHSHGHSHEDMNMRGVFLHVMGDALGNVGVIASALIIWLTEYSWRYYFDPAISLIITVIILWSAIPLCIAASQILLQAVPAGLSIADITSDINSLEGVESTHDLHVWQLSGKEVVASLHVKVKPGIKGTGSAGYMRLAKEIRHCLREFDISKATIQPEFMEADDEHLDEYENETSHRSSGSSGDALHNAMVSGKAGSKSPSLRSRASDTRVCMLEPAVPQVQAHAHHEDHDHSHGHTVSKPKDGHQK